MEYRARVKTLSDLPMDEEAGVACYVSEVRATYLSLGGRWVLVDSRQVYLVEEKLLPGDRVVVESRDADGVVQLYLRKVREEDEVPLWVPSPP